MTFFEEEFSRVRRLSDADLLQGLGGLLGICRKATAQVIAFLGEVDERRLHLLAGSSSMFAYCTGRLRMSEDEACRRIGVARLARRFPVLLDRIAAGSVSLSVAALLERHLSAENNVALLAAVSSKTVAQAREVLAAWFPQADVPAVIRKLPMRQPEVSSATGTPSLASVVETAAGQLDLPSDPGCEEPVAKPMESAATVPAEGVPAELPPVEPPPATFAEPSRPAPPIARPPSPARATASSRNIIQPLSPDRYKVQFTADAELKRKLEPRATCCATRCRRATSTPSSGVRSTS